MLQPEARSPLQEPLSRQTVGIKHSPVETRQLLLWPPAKNAAFVIDVGGRHQLVYSLTALLRCTIKKGSGSQSGGRTPNRDSQSDFSLAVVVRSSVKTSQRTFYKIRAKSTKWVTWLPYIEEVACSSAVATDGLFFRYSQFFSHGTNTCRSG